MTTTGSRAPASSPPATDSAGPTAYPAATGGQLGSPATTGPPARARSRGEPPAPAVTEGAGAAPVAADPPGVRGPREILDWSRQLVEPALRAAVASLPASMRTVAGYHFGWWEADGTPVAGGFAGGKAIRPALALLAAEAVGAAPADALPGAAAVELIHNFTLIQDDFIDADLTRRHRPTVWSVFGPGQAIIAGDALLSLAFDVLSAAAPGREGTRLLHRAVQRLVDGQAADLAFEQRREVGLAECLAMAEGKSGALLGCACAVGAWLGNGTEQQQARLHDFGTRLGVAFQLVDDLLGIWGDPAVTGKPVHSDLHRRKKSLPVVAALGSGTRAGAELAAIYRENRPLAPAEVDRAALLVDHAGGRSWSRRYAAELLRGARTDLRHAVGTEGRPAAELGQLAHLAVHRDR